MESALLSAVDLPGRSRSPSTQDSIPLPFPGHGFFGGVLGCRRGPNPSQQRERRAGMFEPWYPRGSGSVGEHSLSPQVSDSFLRSSPCQPALSQLCAWRTCASDDQVPSSLAFPRLLVASAEGESEPSGARFPPHGSWFTENKPSRQEEATRSVEG